MPRVFIGVGSNIQPEENTVKAIQLLAHAVQIRAASVFYENPAEDRPDQPHFINGVIEVDTDMHPTALKSILHDIEDRLGRVRTEDKFAPRTIDMDILAYGELKGMAGDLTIPDPTITERPFLAIPMAELAPDFILPGTDRSMKEIADDFREREMTPMNDITEKIREAVKLES